jgi:hypothetical protein
VYQIKPWEAAEMPSWLVHTYIRQASQQDHDEPHAPAQQSRAFNLHRVITTPGVVA